MFKTSIIGFLAALAAILASGCATITFPSASAGRSRVEQLILSGCIDESVDRMTQGDLSALTGKKVFVRVGDIDDQDRTSDYIRTAVEQRLSALNIIPVEQPEEADANFIVRARVAGIDCSGEGFNPLTFIFSFLYDHKAMRGAAELEGVAVAREARETLWRSGSTGIVSKSYVEFTLLIFLGPFRNSDVNIF